MLRNVSKNVNKCSRMLTNVGSCWIEMLDENVTKNVVECSGILRKRLWNFKKCYQKCWRMLEYIMLSNVVEILRDFYWMLRNVGKYCSKCWRMLENINVIKCERNFKRMWSNVRKC